MKNRGFLFIDVIVSLTIFFIITTSLILMLNLNIKTHSKIKIDKEMWIIENNLKNIVTMENAKNFLYSGKQYAIKKKDDGISYLESTEKTYILGYIKYINLEKIEVLKKEVYFDRNKIGEIFILKYEINNEEKEKIIF